MTDALGPGLPMVTLHGAARPFHWRTRRCKEQGRHDAADDCSVKAVVVNEVVEDWVSGASRQRQLDGTFSKTPLELVEIAVEPGARISNDNRGFRLDIAACFGPQIVGIVQGRLIT